MKGVCASWTAGCGLTSNSRRKSPTLGALGPATSREGRGIGRRGGSANFQNPLPHIADIPVLSSDMFQQSNMKTVSLLQFIDDLDIPVVQQRQVRGLMDVKTVVVPQLQFIVGRRHSFRSAEAVPMVQSIQQTTEIPLCLEVRKTAVSQLQFITVADTPFVAQHRCCPWSLRPWSFPSCVWTGRSMPLLCRSCGSEFFYSPLYLAVTCSVFAFRVEDSGLSG